MTAALKLPSLLDEKQDWTVDDLTSLPKDLRYELIDGRLVVPSPTAFHQLLCAELMLMLRPHCPTTHVPVIDLSLEVDWRNEPRPDVVALRPDHVATSPLPVEDVVLAVEVVSPESIFRDMYDKARGYAHAGVPAYWVIDPLHGPMTLTELALGDDGEYATVRHTAEVFTTEQPWPVTLDLPALTRRRATLLERNKT